MLGRPFRSRKNVTSEELGQRQRVELLHRATGRQPDRVWAVRELAVHLEQVGRADLRADRAGDGDVVRRAREQCTGRRGRAGRVAARDRHVFVQRVERLLADRVDELLRELTGEVVLQHFVRHLRVRRILQHVQHALTELRRRLRLRGTFADDPDLRDPGRPSDGSGTVEALVSLCIR